MGVIEVNGIRVYAYHGCLPEEATIGGRYVVDVRITGDFATAEASDALADTVDYGRVAAIVQAQMAVRSRLIEHVGRRVLDALKAEWNAPYHWEVRLTKEHPPIAGAVDRVIYVIAG
jgi:7,8-dihydroneopterin aldolase/epimerase/oxygenase